MATAAAISLVVLFHSTHNSSPMVSMADAFTLPQSAVERPQTKTLTRTMFQKSDSDDNEPSHLVRNNPIRTKKPLTRLTHRQEVTLLEQMRDNPAHSSISQVARQTLLLHNLPLVQSIVTKILRSRPHLVAKAGNVKPAGSSSGTALTRDDLLHEGTIGLAEAIDRYDLAYAHEVESNDSVLSRSSSLPKGARLGTYATYWIRARIIRAIQSREHAIRVPEHALQASHRLVKAAKEMGLNWEYVVELAEYDVISASQERLREKLRVKAGIDSESLFRESVRVRTLSRAGAVTPLESWMSGSGDDTNTELSLEAGQDHIRETLSKFLTPREAEVLSLRYGLVSFEDEESEPEAKAEEVSQPVGFRNYQAEAETDLFGPEGMLSHYSTTPNSGGIVSAVSPAKAAKSRTRKVPIGSMSPTTIKTMGRGAGTSPTALLPFKEIGKRMQFSGEYCRRTCSVALSKLTRAVEEGRLSESDFALGW
eukprot:CAMPEP_0183721258 /NCGR_PEP_ID=MMETSP0737-20130205/13590_1 /TAXON_ID=385413 /ORGANISM="Thalassiosira miniscula, Strain CCMP1093" /LENGTH=479 /DNA_ID=CAMNT_0025951235 /DNA_START=436 /DNA_END=1875 /DNA_ORIENTATION=+